MSLKTKRKHPKQTEYEYRCIDGNWTRHPEAVCKRYNGVLTKGLINTHGCRKRACRRLVEGQTWQ